MSELYAELPVDLDELKPHGNFPKRWSFGKKVGTLRRPYHRITEEECTTLENHGVDVFTDGTNFYTYGDADDGKALMPVVRDIDLLERVSRETV